MTAPLDFFKQQPWLVALQVTDKFKFVCWELASAPIAEMVHGKFTNLQWYQLSDLFETMGSNPRASQMLGQLFEQHAHVLGRRGVPATLGITPTADSVGYLPRAGTPAAVDPAGRHPYSRYCSNNAQPAAAAPATSSAAAASGAMALAPAPPGTQGNSYSLAPSCSGGVVLDLDQQQQDHFRMLIAAAYNRPHRRQLDLGGQLFLNIYLEPVRATQGSWDAAIWDDSAGFLIVQYTSNVKHGLILKYVMQMLQRVKRADPSSTWPVHIVLAVPEHPPELFPAFPAQKFIEDNRTLQWDEVPQEVLDIPMWKIKLPMTPAKMADAKQSRQAGIELQTRERVRFMQICDMTAEQLRDELRQLGKAVGGNKVQVRNRLLRLEGLLPYGVGAGEGHDNSSIVGLAAKAGSSSSDGGMKETQALDLKARLGTDGSAAAAA
jgi:hypothetical protein